MSMWRWLGSVICVAGVMALLSFGMSADAQDKGKTDDKKTEVKKADDKKPDEKKPDEKKPADKKTEEKKTEDKGKTVEPPPSKTGEGLEFKAFAKPGNTFYQKLTTKTNQNMKVMNQEVKQDQEQTFYIEWKVLEPKGDNYVVNQRIIGVKMNIDIGGNKISYDSTDEKAPANPMTDFFKALTQADLKLTLNKKLEVVDIEGADGLIEKLGGTNTQLMPLLKSILSKDALKQMAEPTWGAFPLGGVKQGGTWNKDLRLDLGGIGVYTTKYTYTLEKDEPSKSTVKIDAKLTYAAPSDKKGLPFVIKSATLESKDGSGTAVINKDKGRIENSNIKMRLEGNLDIEVGGMTTTVALTQDQTSTVETMDANPLPGAGAGSKKQ